MAAHAHPSDVNHCTAFSTDSSISNEPLFNDHFFVLLCGLNVDAGVALCRPHKVTPVIGLQVGILCVNIIASVPWCGAANPLCALQILHMVQTMG